MQYGRKAVWSIPYVSVALFASLKQNFIAYRSSKVSWRPDCISEIHQLWKSGFSRVYSNYCYSCSFEAEIIKIGQSSHKMYSNNIVHVQESKTILDACTKICSASRICSFCLLFWCSNIVVLSVRIFRNCVVGHVCFLKCWAIELVSERCIVSLLDRVVEVKPTYMLLLSEIQSPKGLLNSYITLVFYKTPIEEEELFLMTKFEVLNLL